ILHNLSILFERTFATAQELNRYRREVTARANGAADGP
ncbi:ferritin-like domain-containing protein, partial [Burkholderia cenocepacia]